MECPRKDLSSAPSAVTEWTSVYKHQQDSRSKDRQQLLTRLTKALGRPTKTSTEQCSTHTEAEGVDDNMGLPDHTLAARLQAGTVAVSGDAYVTKDSGKRQVFTSGMVRDTEEGKLKPHLCLSGPMFDRWAGLMTRGAEKYEEDNWMLAQGTAEYQRFRASAFRHFMQWWRGENDEDHAAAVFFNINGAEYVEDKLNAEDDRIPF